MVFTADGSKLLVANEGEPVTITLPGGGSQLINPEGSVSIVDLSGGAASAAVSTTIAFDLLDGYEAVLKQAGVALLTGQTASADIEPEYITVSPDGTRAYVTLQEVNAVAVIDLTDPAATKPLAILPLGGVDRSLAGNEFDGDRMRRTAGNQSPQRRRRRPASARCDREFQGRRRDLFRHRQRGRRPRAAR